VGPLLPSIQDTFSISVAVSGTLVSASTAFVGIGTGLAAYLVSKIGEQKTVLLGFLIFSIPLGASGFIRNFDLFAPLFVFSGLGGGLMTTPTYSISAAMFPKRKGTAIGFVSASYNLGGFIGPTLSGVLLNYLGWQYPFFAMGLIGIIFTIVFQLSLSGFKTPVRDNSVTFSREFRNLISNRNIIVVALSMLLADFGFLAYITYTVQYFGDRFGLSQAALVPIDFYFGVAVGIGGLGIITLGLLFDRIGGKTTAIIGGAATTVFTIALYSVTNIEAAILLMFVVGFFMNSFWGILSAVAQVNVPEYSRGSAVSFVQTVAFVGAVLGPAIAAGLFGKTVTAGPLLITVTLPYGLFTILIFALYSTTQAKQTLNLQIS
jgi:MFS family permease